MLHLNAHHRLMLSHNREGLVDPSETGSSVSPHPIVISDHLCLLLTSKCDRLLALHHPCFRMEQ